MSNSTEELIDKINELVLELKELSIWIIDRKEEYERATTPAIERILSKYAL